MYEIINRSTKWISKIAQGFIHNTNYIYILAANRKQKLKNIPVCIQALRNKRLLKNDI